MISDGFIDSLALSPDGARIASGYSVDSKYFMCVWDITTRKPLFDPITVESSLYSLAFSPDNLQITSDSENVLNVWDALNGQSIFSLEGVDCVAYSSDGSYTASGSDDHSVIIWNAKTGERTFPPFVGHSNRINSIAFSSDASRIASASDDGTIRVWGLKTDHSISKKFEFDNTQVYTLNTWAQMFSTNVKNYLPWTLGEDGWIHDDHGHLLVWVPANVRPTLCHFRNLTIIDPQFSTKLTFRCND